MKVEDGRLVVARCRWFDHPVVLLGLIVYGISVCVAMPMFGDTGRMNSQRLYVVDDKGLWQIEPHGVGDGQQTNLEVLYRVEVPSCSDRLLIGQGRLYWAPYIVGESGVPDPVVGSAERTRVADLLADEYEMIAAGGQSELLDDQPTQAVAAVIAQDLRAGVEFYAHTTRDYQWIDTVLVGVIGLLVWVSMAEIVPLAVLWFIRLIQSMYIVHRSEMRIGRGQCARCAYDISGCDSCPECGAPLAAVALGPGAQIWWRSSAVPADSPSLAHAHDRPDPSA